MQNPGFGSNFGPPNRQGGYMTPGANYPPQAEVYGFQPSGAQAPAQYFNQYRPQQQLSQQLPPQQQQQQMVGYGGDYAHQHLDDQYLMQAPPMPDNSAIVQLNCAAAELSNPKEHMKTRVMLEWNHSLQDLSADKDKRVQMIDGEALFKSDQRIREMQQFDPSSNKFVPLPSNTNSVIIGVKQLMTIAPLDSPHVYCIKIGGGLDTNGVSSDGSATFHTVIPPGVHFNEREIFSHDETKMRIYQEYTSSPYNANGGGRDYGSPIQELQTRLRREVKPDPLDNVYLIPVDARGYSRDRHPFELWTLMMKNPNLYEDITRNYLMKRNGPNNDFGDSAVNAAKKGYVRVDQDTLTSLIAAINGRVFTQTNIRRANEPIPVTLGRADGKEFNSPDNFIGNGASEDMRMEELKHALKQKNKVGILLEVTRVYPRVHESCEPTDSKSAVVTATKQ